MNRYIFSQIKKTIINKRFIILIIAITATIFICEFESYSFEYQFLDFFLMGVYDDTTAIISLVFPLICTIPYALSYYNDANSGYGELILLKTSKTKYSVSKYIVNFICSGLSLMIPILIYYIFCIIFCGTSVDNDYITTYNTFLPEVRINYPFIYGFIFVINSFLCGAMFSSIALAVASWINNKYIIFLSPFIFYVATQFLAPVSYYLSSDRLYKLNTAMMEYSKLSSILIYDFILLIGAFTIFIIGNHYRFNHRKG